MEVLCEPCQTRRVVKQFVNREVNHACEFMPTRSQRKHEPASLIPQAILIITSKRSEGMLEVIIPKRDHWTEINGYMLEVITPAQNLRN
jgi:hypothetical protein